MNPDASSTEKILQYRQALLVLSHEAATMNDWYPRTYYVRRNTVLNDLADFIPVNICNCTLVCVDCFFIFVRYEKASYAYMFVRILIANSRKGAMERTWLELKGMQ